MVNKYKKCKTCLIDKPIEGFHSNGWEKRATGKKVKSYKSDCKQCANAKWKARIEERLNQLVTWRCIVCGYDRCISALELHHKESSEKEFTISSRWSISMEKLEKEVKKCVVLCCRCHRELHAGIIDI